MRKFAFNVFLLSLLYLSLCPSAAKMSPAHPSKLVLDFLVSGTVPAVPINVICKKNISLIIYSISTVMAVPTVPYYLPYYIVKFSLNYTDPTLRVTVTVASTVPSSLPYFIPKFSENCTDLNTDPTLGAYQWIKVNIIVLYNYNISSSGTNRTRSHGTVPLLINCTVLTVDTYRTSTPRACLYFEHLPNNCTDLSLGIHRTITTGSCLSSEHLSHQFTDPILGTDIPRHTVILINRSITPFRARGGIYSSLVVPLKQKKFNKYLCRIRMEGQLLKDYEELMEGASPVRRPPRAEEGDNEDPPPYPPPPPPLLPPPPTTDTAPSLNKGGNVTDNASLSSMGIVHTGAGTDSDLGSNSGMEGISSTGGTSSSGVENDLFTMGPTYQRCKSARSAGLTITSTDCTAGPTLGKKGTLKDNRVGSLVGGEDIWLQKTFRGSRVTANGQIVNQNMSSSFDPATLTCLVCDTPHSIIPKDGTGLVLIIGDQNFVSAIVGRQHCIPVVRIEDAGLSELFKMGVEILDRNPLPQSTHFMVGSASHLARVGTTLYALEWQRMVRDFTHRWLHATVGPLSPVLREQTAPEVCRQLTELKAWFDVIYQGNITYQTATWNKMISILSCPPDSGTDLFKDDIYTVAMPAGLVDPNLKPHKYHVSSCHAASTEFGGATTDELICVLLDELHCNFGCSAHSDDYNAREPADSLDTETHSDQKTVLLIGGSHCRRLYEDLRRMGYTVIDKSIPGWQPTDKNITELHTVLTELGNLQGVTVIFDLVSNITFRCTQMDGQQMLPIKLGNRYHLLGEVTTVTKELLVGTLKKLRGILSLLPGIKVCVSPLPRYLHTPCCADQDHCVGVGTVDHPPKHLVQVAKVRKVLREYLTGTHANMYVPDLLSMMLPGINGFEALANSLKSFTAEDGVHLTAEGYSVLSETIHEFIRNKITAVSLVSGRAAGEKPSNYYWRGFVSPVGAARPDRKFAIHENRQGGGKLLSNRYGKGHRGGRSYPPGGRNWN